MPCSLHTPAFQGFSLSSLCLFSLATQAVGCPVFRYTYTIPLTLVLLTCTDRIGTFAQCFKLFKFSLQYLMQCCNLPVQTEPMQYINNFLTLRAKLQLQSQTKTLQQSSTACICRFLHCSRILLAGIIEMTQFKSFGSQSMKVDLQFQP